MATKDYSTKQENMIAKYLGWKTVVASGAKAFHPGDIISPDFWLGELKTHVKPQEQLHFNYSVWGKIQEEAMFKHRRPILIVDNGTQEIENTYCLSKSAFINGEDYKVLRIAPISSVHINLSINTLKDNKFKNSILETTWHNTRISILPLTIFKEIQDC